MQRTRWLLIGVLVLASAGCARRDWVSDLLVLTDVTGTWEGSLRPQFYMGRTRPHHAGASAERTEGDWRGFVVAWAGAGGRSGERRGAHLERENASRTDGRRRRDVGKGRSFALSTLLSASGV